MDIPKDKASRKQLISELKKIGITAFYNKFSARSLAAKSFDVGTLVDVGVFRGTRALYDAYPGVPVVLVDPLPGAAEAVAANLGNRQTFINECATGRKPGRASFEVHESGGKSSLLERSSNYPGNVVRKIEVDVRTLDDVMSSHAHTPPFGIKIDTEGFEVETLQGAPETIVKSSFVIVETSVKRRFAQNYRFSEVIAIMAAHGFELCDVLNAKGNAPFFFDCLFVPYQSSLFD